MGQLSHFGRAFSKWLPSIASGISKGIVQNAQKQKENEANQESSDALNWLTMDGGANKYQEEVPLDIKADAISRLNAKDKTAYDFIQKDKAKQESAKAFEWLSKSVGKYRETMPEIDIDNITKLNPTDYTKYKYLQTVQDERQKAAERQKKFETQKKYFEDLTKYKDKSLVYKALEMSLLEDGTYDFGRAFKYIEEQEKPKVHITKDGVTWVYPNGRVERVLKPREKNGKLDPYFKDGYENAARGVGAIVGTLGGMKSEINDLNTMLNDVKMRYAINPDDENTENEIARLSYTIKLRQSKLLAEETKANEMRNKYHLAAVSAAKDKQLFNDFKEITDKTFEQSPEKSRDGIILYTLKKYGNKKMPTEDLPLLRGYIISQTGLSPETSPLWAKIMQKIKELTDAR